MEMKKNKSYKDYTKKLFIDYSSIPIFLLVVILLFSSIFIIRSQEFVKAKDSAKDLSQVFDEEINKFENQMEYVSRDSNMGKAKSKRNLEDIYFDFYKFNAHNEIKANLFVYNGKDCLVKTVDEPTDNFMVLEEEKLNDNIKIQILKNRKPYDKTIVRFIKWEGRIRFIFEWEDSEIYKLLNSHPSTINTLIGGYNEVISTNNDIVELVKINKFINGFEGTTSYKSNDKSYFYSKVEVGNSMFTVISLFEKSNLNKLFSYYIAFVAIVGALLYILQNIIASKVAEKNTKAISILNDYMEDIKKGIISEHNIDEDVYEEFNELLTSYNEMVISLNDLIEKNKDMALLNKESELRFLEQQFNPHFIFNVLENIKYTISIQPDEAKRMLVNLSKILRYSIRNQEEFYPIKEDNLYITAYLELQKQRYKDRLDYKIEISENLEETYIPKLLVQPLIENAINYTYKYKENLKISIKIVSFANDSILIVVEDDGIGMKEEKLREINSNFESNKNKMGIGLYNINKRLKLIYNDKYTLNIYSKYNEGTLVEIIIPKEI